MSRAHASSPPDSVSIKIRVENCEARLSNAICLPSEILDFFIYILNKSFCMQVLCVYEQRFNLLLFFLSHNATL